MRVGHHADRERRQQCPHHPALNGAQSGRRVKNPAIVAAETMHTAFITTLTTSCVPQQVSACANTLPFPGAMN